MIIECVECAGTGEQIVLKPDAEGVLSKEVCECEYCDGEGSVEYEAL